MEGGVRTMRIRAKKKDKVEIVSKEEKEFVAENTTA